MCVESVYVYVCVFVFFFSEWNRGWQDVIFLCPVCMYFLLVRPLATMKQTTDSFFRKKKDQRVPLQVSGMELVRHFLLKNAFQQKWLIQLRLLYDIIEQDCHVLFYCSVWSNISTEMEVCQQIWNINKAEQKCEI